jgi:hypothetical protein
MARNNYSLGTVLLAIPGMIVAVVVMVVVFSAIAAVPVWLFWNYLFAGHMPFFDATCDPILGFALPSITFWQAWALSMMCGALFKSTNTNSGSKKD